MSKGSVENFLFLVRKAAMDHLVVSMGRSDEELESADTYDLFLRAYRSIEPLIEAYRKERRNDRIFEHGYALVMMVPANELGWVDRNLFLQPYRFKATITGCSADTFWYQGRVGETITIERNFGSEYLPYRLIGESKYLVSEDLEILEPVYEREVQTS